MNCGALNSTAEQPVAVLGVCRQNLVPGKVVSYLEQSVTVTADIHDSLTENIQYWEIYTTIGSLSAKICPQNVTYFKPGDRNSTPIIASLFMRAHRGLHVANLRPLDRFLRSIVLCFLLRKKINNVAIRHRCDFYAAVFA